VTDPAYPVDKTAHLPELYKPQPNMATKNPLPSVETLREDVVRAKIGLIQLDACEVAATATMAQITLSPGLRREQLIKATVTLERLVGRVKELLK
jgi:hypothetical protein